MYIPHQEIDDEDDEDDPRFSIIFTSRKLLQRHEGNMLHQIDATYRINWQDFPILITGTSTPTGKFHPSSAVLVSHEDTWAFASVYKFFHDQEIYTKFRMADGAKEITKAREQVGEMLFLVLVIEFFQKCIFRKNVMFAEWSLPK